MKKLINESEFNEKLNLFLKESDIELCKKNKVKFFKYIKTKEHIVYEVSWLNVPVEGMRTNVWTSLKFEVPINKRGHLKVYRGFEVLILNLPRTNFYSRRNGYKRTLGVFPLKKVVNE